MKRRYNPYDRYDPNVYLNDPNVYLAKSTETQKDDVNVAEIDFVDTEVQVCSVVTEGVAQTDLRETKPAALQTDKPIANEVAVQAAPRQKTFGVQADVESEEKSTPCDGTINSKSVDNERKKMALASEDALFFSQRELKPIAVMSVLEVLPPLQKAHASKPHANKKENVDKKPLTPLTDFLIPAKKMTTFFLWYMLLSFCFFYKDVSEMSVGLGKMMKMLSFYFIYLPGLISINMGGSVVRCAKGFFSSLAESAASSMNLYVIRMDFRQNVFPLLNQNMSSVRNLFFDSKDPQLKVFGHLFEKLYSWLLEYNKDFLKEVIFLHGMQQLLLSMQAIKKQHSSLKNNNDLSIVENTLMTFFESNAKKVFPRFSLIATICDFYAKIVLLQGVIEAHQSRELSSTKEGAVVMLGEVAEKIECNLREISCVLYISGPVMMTQEVFFSCQSVQDFLKRMFDCYDRTLVNEFDKKLCLLKSWNISLEQIDSWIAEIKSVGGLINSIDCVK